MHNGLIRDFSRVHRALLLAIAPELFPEIKGTTDSEIMFYLALTFDLEHDPVGAVERMAGFIEATGRKEGIENPLQMSVSVSDGRRLFAFRYSSEHSSCSLFHSLTVESLRELDPRFDDIAHGTFAIVSEPLTELSDYWEEVPESTVVTVADREIVTRPFQPRVPS